MCGCFVVLVCFAGSGRGEEQRSSCCSTLGGEVGGKTEGPEFCCLVCCVTIVFAPGLCFQTKSFEMSATSAGFVQPLLLKGWFLAV